jgi:hypothetical protein
MAGRSQGMDNEVRSTARRGGGGCGSSGSGGRVVGEHAEHEVGRWFLRENQSIRKDDSVACVSEMSTAKGF